MGDDYTPKEVSAAVGLLGYKRGRFDVAQALLELTARCGIPLHPSVRQVLESEVVTQPEVNDESVIAEIIRARGH